MINGFAFGIEATTEVTAPDYRACCSEASIGGHPLKNP